MSNGPLCRSSGRSACCGPRCGWVGVLGSPCAFIAPWAAAARLCPLIQRAVLPMAWRCGSRLRIAGLQACACALPSLSRFARVLPGECAGYGRTKPLEQIHCMRQSWWWAQRRSFRNLVGLVSLVAWPKRGLGIFGDWLDRCARLLPLKMNRSYYACSIST